MTSIHEGWLYVAAAVDLFARPVVGWSMGSRIDADLVLDALLAAVWRRRPKVEVIIHSDQDSQFGSHDWRDFLKTDRRGPSMSRRGNCHGNAVAESFFSCSSPNGFAVTSTLRESWPGPTSSITSRCSTARGDAIGMPVTSLQ